LASDKGVEIHHWSLYRKTDCGSSYHTASRDTHYKVNVGWDQAAITPDAGEQIVYGSKTDHAC
jgi:hypothetical protein